MRPDGSLRRDQDRGARIGGVDDRPGSLEHEVDIGAVVLVDRRVVRDPDELRTLERLLPTIRELERPVREPSTDELGEPRLVHGQDAVSKSCDDGGVLVECDDSMSCCRDACRRDDPEVPEAGDADPQGPPSTSGVLSPVAGHEGAAFASCRRRPTHLPRCT